MDKTQKKNLKKFLSWGCIALLVIVLTIMPLLAGSNEELDGPEASILSATALRTDIDTELIGGGTLSSESAWNLTIPSSVKLIEYLVSNGDVVEEGNPIAKVDRVSVMSAITEVQETLDYLAEEIEDESAEKAPDTVNAQTGGVVKIIYAQAGDSVQNVMLEYGALAVLSLDGLMAVQVERSTDLVAGDTVCITLSDGTEVDGRVESNLDGILTVTLDDDNYLVGENVKVTTDDGTRIGTGELYIHSRWNATAYSGTVKSVKVSEGNNVSAGTALLTLEDTGSTARYQQLIAQHQEYEELMLELFQMYQSQILTAPCSGVISGVDQNGTYMLSDEGSWTLSLLTNAPNGNDEATYSNFVGQVTGVGIDGWILNLNPQNWAVTDYKNLSGVYTGTDAMTENTIYSGSVPVYQLVNEEWQQIESVIAGDILLFAGDENYNFVWIVKIGHEDIETTQPSDPTESTEATSPTEPLNPSEPSEESTEPTGPSAEQPGDSMTAGDGAMSGTITMPQAGGSFAGYSGGTSQEEEVELYSLDTFTVASVTPQEEMTLEITIDELDISKVYIGQTATVTVNALAGESFTASVTEIGSTGTSDGGNSKFTVRLTMPRGEKMLNGMNASASITLDTASNVLSIPVAALNEGSTETIVYTSYDAEKGLLGDPVVVTVGVSDGENAQILSGLEEGTTCYYFYYDTLVISNAPDTGGFSFGR